MLTHARRSPAAPVRVVVLGARGFVAQAAARALRDAGVRVDTVSSADLDLTAAGAGEALAARLQPDDVLAFVSALTPDKGKDIGTMMRNLEMGRQVCDALAHRPCAHVIYVSSDAVYHDDAHPVRETSCCQPSSFHGVMHVARERMLVEAVRGPKIPLAILRPSLLYGPGDTHNGYGPNRFMRMASAGEKITLFGEGEEQRDHVYIGDIARVVRQVVAHRSDGVLNVATGRSWSFREVAEQAVAAAQRSASIVGTPRANPITHRHFDVTAAIAAFPSFSYTNLADGLAQFAAAPGTP